MVDAIHSGRQAPLLRRHRRYIGQALQINMSVGKPPTLLHRFHKWGPLVCTPQRNFVLLYGGVHRPHLLPGGAGLLQTTIRQAPQAGFRSGQGSTIMSLSQDLSKERASIWRKRQCERLTKRQDSVGLQGVASDTSLERLPLTGAGSFVVGR